jgi:hypothetical protein
MIQHRLDAAKVLTKEQRTRFSLAGPLGHGYQYGCGSLGLGYGNHRGYSDGGHFGMMGGGHHWNW